MLPWHAAFKSPAWLYIQLSTIIIHIFKLQMIMKITGKLGTVFSAHLFQTLLGGSV